MGLKMAEERGLVVYQSRDGQEIKLSFDTVRKYLVSGKPELVTDQEIVFYMGTCKARGLNPFKKDCYLVKYTERDPAATIISIDYFRSRGKAQPDCVGWKSGILLHSDHGIEYREGSFIMEGEKVVGGWFRARPKHWETEYTWTVSLTSYIKRTHEGKVTQFWQEEKQAYMIAKVAESQGLRRVWPDEFQGLVLDDEFQALRDVTESQATPIRTPQALAEKQKDDPTTKVRSSDSRTPQSANHAATNDEQASASHNDDSKPRPEKKQKRTAEKPQASKQAPAPQGEKTQEDWIAECELWIEQATPEQLYSEDNWLFQTGIRQVKGTANQMKVLKPFNDRRQALAKSE